MCIGGTPAATMPAQTVASRVPDGDATVRADDQNRLRMIRAATILNNGSTASAPATTSSGVVGSKSTLG